MRNLLKLIVFMILFVLPFKSKANPIIIEYPQVFISELSFQANSDWTLELEMFCKEMFPLPGSIDSVVIHTNWGSARLLSFPYENHALFLITKDNLSSPLVINPLQDTIRILTYLDESTGYTSFGEYLMHELIFGYPESVIPFLAPNQSICAWEITFGYPVCFYKDNSPTMGYQNDTTGATATLHGMFYDYLNRLIMVNMYQYDFSISNNVTSYYYELYQTSYFVSLAEFNFDISGSYTTQVLSGNRNVSLVDHLYNGGCPYGYPYMQALSCESFGFNLEPGQVMEQNILLTDSSFNVGLKEMIPALSTNLSLVCAPNPFSEFVDFYLSSAQSISNTEIQIFNVKGQLVKTIHVDNNTLAWSGRVTKGDLGSSGIYFYLLIEEGKKIKSGQIICH